jgi:hypothetical protein
MKSLNNIELRNINGGEGFAHDAGCAIRYAFVYIGYSFTFKSHEVGKTFADAANSGGCSE